MSTKKFITYMIDTPVEEMGNLLTTGKIEEEAMTIIAMAKRIIKQLKLEEHPDPQNESKVIGNILFNVAWKEMHSKKRG